jgi:hypothetical protein
MTLSSAHPLIDQAIQPGSHLLSHQLTHRLTHHGGLQVMDAVWAPLARAATWLAAPSPAPNGGGNVTVTPVQPSFSGKFSLLLGWVAWGCFSLCVIGVMVIGVQLALSFGRGQGGEHAMRLGTALFGVIIVGAASGIVGALL